MKEHKFRELQREWAQTGCPEAEAAIIQELLRAGDLSEQRVMLAARCGNPGALYVYPEHQAHDEWIDEWLTNTIETLAIPSLRFRISLHTLSAIWPLNLAFEVTRHNAKTAARLALLICLMDGGDIKASATELQFYVRILTQTIRLLYRDPLRRISQDGVGITALLICLAQLTAEGAPYELPLLRCADVRRGDIALATIFTQIKGDLIHWSLNRKDPLLDFLAQVSD